MAAINWKSGVSGDWTDAADWSGGVVPGSADTVTIAASGTYTVTITTADAAQSLTLDDSGATVADTGTLALGGALAITAGTFALNTGGDISGGTISTASAGLFQANGGTLNGVAYQGALTVGVAGDLFLAGTDTFSGTGGSGAGTINLTGAGSALDAVGALTLNNAIVNFGGAATTDTLYLDAGSASTTLLTLGSTLDLVQSASASDVQINLYNRTGSAGGLVNDGTITASASGGTFNVYGGSYGTFLNAGKIAVSGGDTFIVNAGGGFTNTGTVTVASGGLLQLQGTLTAGAVTKISNSGGTIDLSGLLNNAGTTTTIPTGFVLTSGTIFGGKVIDATGQLSGNGTLSGVAYDGTLAVGAGDDIFLAGTTTFAGSNGSGTGVINLTAANAALDGIGTTTITNATLNFGGADTTDTLYLDAGSASSTLLTLGSTLNLVQSASASDVQINLYNRTASAGGLVNDGTITASASGGTFNVFGGSYGTFLNAGKIAISNGDTFIINAGGGFTNTGTVTLASNAVLELQGTLTAGAVTKISNSGGTIELIGTLSNTGATVTVPTGFVLSNGTIAGGTVIDATGRLSGNGTLSGVAYDGTLAVGAGDDIFLAGTTTFAGSNGSGTGVINLTAANAALDGIGTATITNATLNFGGADTTDTLYLDAGSASSTLLTLGSTLNLVQSASASDVQINLYNRTASAGGLVNDGTITASASGGTFNVFGGSYGTFLNAGKIAISNGDVFNANNLAGFINTGSISATGSGTVLDLGGTWSSTSAISISGSAVVNLGGTFTTASFDSISNSGGTANLTGLLNNTAATLTVPSGLVLSGGTIEDGVVSDASGLLSGSGTLSGVSYEGTLNTFSGQVVHLAGTDDFSATGGGTALGTLNLTGESFSIDTIDGTVLNNAFVNVGGAGNTDTIYLQTGTTSSATLTLGGTTDVSQTGSASSVTINLYQLPDAGTLINQGTLTAAAAAGTFTVYNAGSQVGIFSNAGTVAVSNGDGFTATSLTDFTNTGSLSVSGGSTFSAQTSTFTNLASGTLTAGRYEADAGSTLQIYAPTSVTSDAATIVLSGAGSVFEFYNSATATNTTLDQKLTSISSAGTLELLAGRNFSASAAFDAAGLLELGGGTFTTTGLTVNSTGSVEGYGTVAAPVAASGQIESSTGNLDVTGAITGAAALVIIGGSTLELGTTVASTATASFAGQGGILKLDDVAGFAAKIAGDAAGDVIDVSSTTITAASATGTVLSLVTSTGSTINLILKAAVSGERFGVSSDGHGGTDVTAYRYAAASTHTPEPVALGNVHVGGSATQTLSITNTATADGFSEKLDASMGAPTTGVTASGSFTGLAAGATQSTALVVGLNTAKAGAVSGTATIGLSTDGTGIDGGAPLSIGTQTVHVTGAVYAYADPTIANSGTVALGNVHVGGSASGHATLTNSAATGGYSEALDAGFSGAAAGFTATGSLTGLAAGASNSTSLAVGFTSATAGAISGKATLSLTSDGTGIDGLGTTALPAGTVTITGAAYALASATFSSTSITLGVVHVGSNATKDLSVKNSAATGGYSEALDANFSGSTGSATASGNFTGLVAGATNATSLAVGVSTSTSGTFSGTDIVALTSDGTGIDGLGTTALSPSTITVTGIVDNYALAAFEDPSGPAISGSGTAFTLNLGSFEQGGTADVIALGARNAATGLADLLDGTLTTAGGTDFANSGFGSFSGLAAGAGEDSQSVTLTTSTAGTYSETVVLSSFGTNASGYSGALAPETLTITGTITPAGSTTYTLAVGPNDIVGANGGDVFQAPNGSLNSHDELTGGTGTNVMQLEGGGFFDLGAPSVFANIPTITATEGQAASGTLAATEQTVFMRNGANLTLNVNAGLPAAGNANPEAILIYGGTGNDTLNLASGHDTIVLSTGTDTITLGGAANSVTAGGGTALISGTSAEASAAIVGKAGSNTTLTITSAGTATLNAADTYLTVNLAASSQLTLGALKFISANGGAGSDTITAGGIDQTLTGGVGDTLTGSTLGTDTFIGATTALNGDTLANWTTGDVIDITNLSSATLSYTEGATNGTLTATLGTTSTSIIFNTTSLSLANFANAGSDGHSGILIDYAQG